MYCHCILPLYVLPLYITRICVACINLSQTHPIDNMKTHHSTSFTGVDIILQGGEAGGSRGAIWGAVGPIQALLQTSQESQWMLCGGIVTKVHS